MENCQYRLVFVGPPLAGKGTQCKLLSEKLGIPHISSGDILRREMGKSTELGRYIKAQLEGGHFVKDEIIQSLITKTINGLKGGFILDGFPRTLEQLNTMDFFYDQIVFISTPLEDILDRARGRLCHLPSGRIYHTKYNPPKTEGLDDITQEPLYKRDDDTVNIIKHRYLDFIEKTGKVVQRGMELKKVTVIDGRGSLEEINKTILCKLAQLSHP
ncbi:adenylate kinase [Nematocida sp. AWRm77]|nr:adenylate kinase [Nematocida sp. AWRm77]